MKVRNDAQAASLPVLAAGRRSVIGIVENPILGPKGNREFLLSARRG